MVPILRSNISAATAPNYGCDLWDTPDLNNWYTFSLQPGASPSGNDAIRFTAIRTTLLGDNGWGCSFSRSLEPSPAQGSVRYARWRMRYVGPVNWRSDNRLGSYEANNRTAPDKMFILGNTCENGSMQPTRVILWQYAQAPSRSVPILRFTQNIGPGPELTNVPVNIWLNVQLKIVSSSSAGAADGSLSIYINNNNESAPTRSAGGIQIKTVGWGRNAGCTGSHILWGDGSFNPLSAADSTARAVTDLADFEYDDQFDPQWAIGAPAMPSAPTNLRIIPAEASVAGPALLAMMLLLRRRKGGRQDAERQ